MNLGGVIGNLSDRARQMYEKEFDSLATCIALFQVQAGGLESWKQAATKTQEFLKSTAAQAQASIDELKRNIEVARKAAEMNALSSYATYFAKEADSHKRAAWWWLISTSAVCRNRWGRVLALGSIWGGLDEAGFADNRSDRTVGGHQGGHPLDAFHCGQSLLASLQVTSPQLCGQRAPKNALKTFQAFVNAPEADAQTKSAVLLEATKCIFSQQPTGYISSEQESQSFQILEIVRQLGPKS